MAEEWSGCCLGLQLLLRNYELDIDELSRKQKLSVEKVELAQTVECKTFNKKLRSEQVTVFTGHWAQSARFGVCLISVFLLYFNVYLPSFSLTNTCLASVVTVAHHIIWNLTDFCFAVGVALKHVWFSSCCGRVVKSMHFYSSGPGSVEVPCELLVTAWRTFYENCANAAEYFQFTGRHV